MGSGGGGGGNPALLTQNAAPMGGLPIAGKDSNIGDPYDYGKFQSFLPNPNPDGSATLARGLTPDMFQYKSPSGVPVSGGSVLPGGSGGSGGVVRNNVDPGASGGNVLPGDTSGGGGGTGGAQDQNSQLRDALTALMASGGPTANNNYLAGPVQQARNIAPSFQNFKVNDPTTMSP
jgi:hypothetical protein